jgi:hypothetical protein
MKRCLETKFLVQKQSQSRKEKKKYTKTRKTKRTNPKKHRRESLWDGLFG